MDYIALANALMAGLEVLIPKIQALAKTGDVTVDEQKAVKERYDALRARGDAAFSGPQWQVEP